MGDYSFKVELVPDETYIMWSVTDGEFDAKMIHKGLAGWMAFGIANPGGAHNGMNGAKIVMGRNVDGASTTVAEYKIAEYSSAFRHWKTPYSSPSLSMTSMNVGGCISEMTFKTASIYGEDLNLTSGTNKLIWGLTHLDYPVDTFGGYSGYHTAAGGFSARSRVRGLIEVDLTSGQKSDMKSEDEISEDTKNEDTEQTSGQRGLLPSLVYSTLLIVLLRL